MTTITTSRTVEMAVPGLCCLECSQDVVTALKRTDGVLGLQVLFTAEKVRVTYEAGMTDPETLVRQVEQVGHPVSAWRPVRRGSRIPVMDNTEVTAAQVQAPPAAPTRAPVEEVAFPPEKKTEAQVVEDGETRVKAPRNVESQTSSGLVDTSDAVSPTKPKRTRRVGEPKPKRYAVGEPEAERDA
jgi:copper chaperone CopZ